MKLCHTQLSVKPHPVHISLRGVAEQNPASSRSSIAVARAGIRAAAALASSKVAIASVVRGGHRDGVVVAVGSLPVDDHACHG